MKIPDAAEIVIGANDEVEQGRLFWSGSKGKSIHADIAIAHGMDGPDELAAAVGKSAG